MSGYVVLSPSLMYWPCICCSHFLNQHCAKVFLLLKHSNKLHLSVCVLVQHAIQEHSGRMLQALSPYSSPRGSPSSSPTRMRSGSPDSSSASSRMSPSSTSPPASPSTRRHWNGNTFLRQGYLQMCKSEFMVLMLDQFFFFQVWFKVCQRIFRWFNSIIIAINLLLVYLN